MEVKNIFISGACNVDYNVFAWHNSRYGAYGSHNLVYIYDLQSNKIICALKGHSGRVNTVRFLRDGRIVSACADGNIIIWRNEHLNAHRFHEESDKWHLWQILCKKVEKGANFVDLNTWECKDNGTILISGCTTNSDLHLFKHTVTDDSTFELIETEKLEFGNSLLECTEFCSYNSVLYLALTASDFNIHIYEVNKEKNTLIYLNSLQGHTDKIGCLSSIAISETEVFLATGSKDKYIRIWRFSSEVDTNMLGSVMQRNIYKIGDNFVYLESTLLGHEDAVSSVHWSVDSDTSELALLSSSLDFTVQVWEREDVSKVWMNTVRLGQMGGNKNTFYGAKFSPGCLYIAAYTYNGCFYLWKRGSSLREWCSLTTSGGHSKAVKDLDWSSGEEFLVSCSEDQTTRVYGLTKEGEWHEMSRAQIHGYDIMAIKCMRLPQAEKGPERKFCDYLICGADEKIMRMIEPPSEFINTFNTLCDKNLHLFIEDPAEENEYIDLNKSTKDCTIYCTKTSGGYQVLGLMTKALKPEKVNFYQNDKIDELYEDSTVAGMDIEYNYDYPPNEDYLVKHTLWPELNKLYGHGYEISSVAVTKKGDIIASSCQSQNEAHSCVFLWDPKSFQVYQELPAHEYTVIQLEFAPSDSLLCTVSKDRKIGIFKREPNSRNFKNVYLETAHKRIIYSCSFSHDEKLLITGSRDKTYKIWAINSESGELQEISLGKCKAGVTAVCFANCELAPSLYHFWIGLETGEVYAQSFDPSNKMVKQLPTPDEHYSHCGSVNRIEVRAQEGKALVSTCSEDHSLRLYEYKIV